MSTKTVVAMAAIVLLGSTALASAQSSAHHRRHAAPQAPYAQENYDPYYGTVFDNVVPYGSNNQPDPYRGTYFDGVAPY